MRIPQVVSFPGQLRDRKTRVLHALDVLLGHDLSQFRVNSMQIALNEMAKEMNHLNIKLNEQAKLVRKIHEMTGYDP